MAILSVNLLYPDIGSSGLELEIRMSFTGLLAAPNF